MAAHPTPARALLHVAVASGVCLVALSTGLFDAVATELGYAHYAEKPVPGLPAFIAMPFNSLVNIAYMALGLYWLCSNDGTAAMLKKGQAGLYMNTVFALMAIVYGPVQWVRLCTMTHRSAVVDQWITLPIFAWVPIWCHSILHGWQPRTSFAIEGLSLSSYALTLVHSQGFELALGCHILAAILSGLRVQQRYGDSTSRTYMCLAVLFCLGFVVLKLLDHELAHWFIFQKVTGHFWSKVCDVLQFHYSFCFLTYMDARRMHAIKK